MDEAEAAEMGMYKKFMSRMRKMMTLDDGADPDAIAEAVEGLVKKGMEMSAREMKRESDDADMKVAARVDGGVIADTVEARTAAKKICMSDRATFELLFPLKEKPAAKSLPGVQPTAAEAALLSARIMPPAPAQAPPSAPQPVDYNDQLYILADQIADEIRLKEPKLDVTTLLMRATSEAKQRLGQKALAGLVR